MNVIDTLSNNFYEFIRKNFIIDEATQRTIDFSLNVDPSKKQFGDITSNAALILSKKLSKQPREIANTIAQGFSDDSIKKIEIAGPGFLNFFLSEGAFKQIAHQLFTQNKEFFKPAQLATNAINIEYVSANPTGPLHLGHGRGGIMGDVLSNVLLFLGNTVTREYYINDAGSQITKLGESLLIRCKQETGQTATMPEDGYHGDYLVFIAQKCISEHGPEVVLNDIEFFKTYAKDHLLDQIRQTLTQYGLVFDVWFSEKTLHESGEIERGIETLKQNGHIYEKDGALWFSSTRFGDDKDRVLKKSDGSYTYVAADVGYMLNKLARGHDKLIIILGQDHHSYVQRLKGLLAGLGHNPESLDVPLYQLVTIKESGELLRMSKRAGRMVTLHDVIETVGKDVARFFYLNKKADAHLDFDLDLALKKSDENPVYYIQYAYVRTRSIIDKASEFFEPITPEHAQHLNHEETYLLKKIVSLRTLLETVGRTYQSHLLTYYALDLAKTFHQYYSTHRVIEPENKEQSLGRLFIVQLVNQTLEFCFELLGITAPEKM